MSEKELIESLETQLQELRKDLQKLREAKKKQDEGHWITVHSDSGHGTHIFIKGDGSVGKGPTGLVGKKFPKAAKKAAKRPSKPSGGTGLGGTMAGTSSLPSSGGGMIDISKYQTSIPLTPAAPKAAAKPATAPKAPKVEPPKPAGPQNIDIGGYKFEMPKAKPTEAPKPAEPPKAVEPPKPLEAPKAAEAPKKADEKSPTLPGHTAPDHWPENAKKHYIGTIKKGSKLKQGTESPFVNSEGKALKDIHLFDVVGGSSGANVADATKGIDAHYLTPTKLDYPYVFSSKEAAEDSLDATIMINQGFLKHKNELKPSPHFVDTKAEAEQMSNKEFFLHPIDPKKFASQAEAEFAQAKDKAESYNKIKSMGVLGITASSMVDKIHPGSSYVVDSAATNEPPTHLAKGGKKTNAKDEPLDLMRYQHGAAGKTSSANTFQSHEDAKKAYEADVSEKAFQIWLNDPVIGKNAPGNDKEKASKIIEKARSMVDINNYKVIDPTHASLAPTHGSWKFANGEARTQYIDRNNAKDYGIKMLDVGSGGVPYDVAKSVKRYSGDYYHSLNKELRKDPTGETLSEGDKKEFKNIREFIKMAGTLPAPITVWRGIKPFNAEGKPVDHDELIRRYSRNIGKTITLNGFQSTSFDPVVAAAFAGVDSKVMFEISTKKGGYMHDYNLSGHTNEREFLLDHGQKYRVLGIDRTPGKMKIIKLEAL